MLEQEAKAIETKFHAVLDYIGDAIFLVSQDFIITEVNKSGCELIQYTAEELVGRKIYELIKGDVSIFKSDIDLIDEQGSLLNERSFIRKDGSLVDTEVHVNRVEGMGYMAVARDITDRKLAELKLKESEEKFRIAFMTGMDAYYISTLEEGRIIEVNDMVYSLLGYTREECIGNTTTGLDFLFDTMDRAMLVERLKEEKHIRDFELKCRKKNGEIFICSFSVSIWTINETDYVLGVLRDVTALKVTESKRVEMLAFESLLSDIAARLVQVHAQQLHHEITNSQRLICEFLNLDLSTIYQPISETGNHLQLSYIYHREANFHYPDILIAADYFPWCEKELLSGKIPVVNSMNDLPAEAECDKQSWNSFGIKSSVMFPMIAGNNEFLGTISFDAMRSEYHFSDELIKRLQLIANLFANIIKRNQSEVHLVEAKEKAEESEERYRNLFQKSHAIMMLVDPVDGQIMDVNPSACSYYGWSREELLKMKVSQINCLNTEKIFGVLSLAQTEKRNHFIFKHRLANGAIRDVEVYSSPLVVAGKKLLYSIIHDITDRKLAEEALIESEKRIQKKLAHLLSPEADISELALEDIIDTDAIQSMMEEFFKFTRIPVAIIDLQGKVLVGPGWQDICSKFHRIHPHTLANCIECDTVLTKGIFPGTFKSYLCKNGLWDNATPLIIGGRHVGNLFTGQFFYEGEKPNDEVFLAQAALYGFNEKEYMDAVSRVPIYPRETIHHVLTFFITLANMISSLSHANIGLAKLLEQRKQIEQELIKAKEQAEENDRLKTAFLQNMSHEIRTPLNSIIGFSDLLLDPFYKEEQKTEFLHSIIKSGNNLLGIISDIMDISKMESGQMTIVQEHFSIEKLIMEIAYEQSQLVQNKGIEMRINIPQQNIQVKGDIMRIKQILINFLNNSIKFTESGFIELGTLLIDHSVQFYVKDTGIGISKENQKKIFERFRQVESSVTRKYGGNGLGLSIASQLAGLMGGKIWVESEVGKGSTFYFSIPIPTV